MDDTHGATADVLYSTRFAVRCVIQDADGGDGCATGNDRLGSTAGMKSTFTVEQEVKCVWGNTASWEQSRCVVICIERDNRLLTAVQLSPD